MHDIEQFKAAPSKVELASTVTFFYKDDVHVGFAVKENETHYGIVTSVPGSVTWVHKDYVHQSDG